MEKRRNRTRAKMDKYNTDLSVTMMHFEVHNRTEGKSVKTVHWYNEVLGLLYRWLKEGGRPTTLGSIDEMVVRQFILYLQGRPAPGDLRFDKLGASRLWLCH